jgi:osmotically-inducible protein OsmY
MNTKPRIPMIPNPDRPTPRLGRASARLALIGALIGSTLASTGCFPIVATGIVVGAMAVVDRRTIGAQTEDQSIELKALADLRQQLGGSGGIAITSFNRTVLLTGQVLDETAKRRAADIVGKVDNVRTVHNELVVSGRASVGVYTADAALTTRVRSALIEAKDLQSNAFKVVTESEVVHLMGIVTRAEGDRAAQLVSRVPGVKRVVTVFEYVTPDELARIERTNREAQKQ